MPKLTAEDINSLYADYIADPGGQVEPFWAAVRDWVVRCDYTATAEIKDDLVQDTVVEIMTHLDRFTAGTDFVKWINAIIRNKRMDCFRSTFYECHEIAFSQLAQEDGEGGFREYEPSSEMEAADDDSDITEPEDRQIEVNARLDAVRASLWKREDLALFDLLRSGMSMKEAAASLGVDYFAAYRRFERWKKKLGQNPFKLIVFPDCNCREELQRAA